MAIDPIKTEKRIKETIDTPLLKSPIRYGPFIDI